MARLVERILVASEDLTILRSEMPVWSGQIFSCGVIFALVVEESLSAKESQEEGSHSCPWIGSASHIATFLSDNDTCSTLIRSGAQQHRYSSLAVGVFAADSSSRSVASVVVPNNSYAHLLRRRWPAIVAAHVANCLWYYRTSFERLTNMGVPPTVPLVTEIWVLRSWKRSLTTTTVCTVKLGARDWRWRGPPCSLVHLLEASTVSYLPEIDPFSRLSIF